MKKAVIVSACRTPFAKVPGKLSSLRDYELMSQCFRKTVDRIGIDSRQIPLAFVGSCLPAYRQNIARKALLEAGFSETISAATVNKRCASGMEALFQGVYRIMCGEAEIVLVGAVESSSNSGYALGYLKENVNKRKTDKRMFQYENLSRSYNDDDMAVIAEKLVRDYQISETELNSHTIAIYKKAAAAQKNGSFKLEIESIIDNERNRVIDTDDMAELITDMEKLKSAVPFSMNDGCLTQYHSARMGDGAASLLLMSEERAKDEGYPILAAITGMECISVPYSQMGTSTIQVVEKLLQKKHMSASDINLFEMSEAFSVQSLLFQRQLKIPDEKLNITGSELALGYAMGSTSLRACVSLAYSLIRCEKRIGIAAVSAGGCMGQGVMMENVRI